MLLYLIYSLWVLFIEERALKTLTRTSLFLFSWFVARHGKSRIVEANVT